MICKYNQYILVDALGTPGSMEIPLIELVAKKKVVRSRHTEREEEAHIATPGIMEKTVIQKRRETCEPTSCSVNLVLRISQS